MGVSVHDELGPHESPRCESRESCEANGPGLVELHHDVADVAVAVLVEDPGERLASGQEASCNVRDRGVDDGVASVEFAPEVVDLLEEGGLAGAWRSDDVGASVVDDDVGAHVDGVVGALGRREARVVVAHEGRDVVHDLLGEVVLVPEGLADAGESE